MKLKIQWTSGPSHQTYANGKPCDRYTGTVYFTCAAYACGWMLFTMQVYGKTAKDVEKTLQQYQWGDIVDIPQDQLDPVPVINRKGERHANA